MGTNTITKRDELIDEIKAIGIILVVVGHALNDDVFSLGKYSFVLRMICIFHLPIFFFCTGYLYKDQKLIKRFLSIFKHQYIPTTLFTLGSFILLPILTRLKLFTPLDLNEIKSRIIDTIRYQPRGVLVGALWYMPFFTVSLILFSLTYKIFGKHKKLFVALALIMGITGVVYGNTSLPKPYYLDYSMRMQPILLLGMLSKEHGLINWIKKNYILCSIVSLILLLIASISYYSNAKAVDLKLVGGIIYYPAIIFGIVFCVALSKMIDSLPIKSLTVFIGRHTFIIMAMHFQAFKVVDLVASAVFGKEYDMTFFPVSSPEWYMRLAYAIVGLTIPLVVAALLDITKDKIKEKRSVDHSPSIAKNA